MLPSREVADTIAPTIEGLRRLDGLVDQILVVDAASRDGTAEIAAALGAEVHQESELLPEFGRPLGKGDAMWRALARAGGDIVVYLDADTRDFEPHFASGLLWGASVDGLTDRAVPLDRGARAGRGRAGAPHPRRRRRTTRRAAEGQQAAVAAVEAALTALLPVDEEGELVNAIVEYVEGDSGVQRVGPGLREVRDRRAQPAAAHRPPDRAVAEVADPAAPAARGGRTADGPGPPRPGPRGRGPRLRRPGPLRARLPDGHRAHAGGVRRRAPPLTRRLFTRRARPSIVHAGQRRPVDC